MKPWELDADAPPNPAGDIPPGGLGIDVPVQRGWQVSAADQKTRDEAARRLKLTETNAPKPWELDADAPAEKSAPTAPTALPQTTKKRSLAEQAMYEFSPEGLKKSVASGYLQNAANLASSIPAQAIGGLVGGARALFPGEQGVGAKWSEKVSNALTYQPVTKAAQDQAAAIAYPFEKANEGLGYVGEQVGGNAGRTIGENLIPVVSTVAPGPKMLRKARAAEEGKNANRFPVRDETTGAMSYYAPEDVAWARKNPELLAAHEILRKYDIATDPSKTNPTNANLRRTTLLDPHIAEYELSKVNDGKYEGIVKQEVGLNPDARLSRETVNALKSNAAVVNEQIAKVDGVIVPDESHLAQLDTIRRDPSIIRPDAQGQMNTLISRTLDTVQRGVTPAEMIRNISGLRQRANDIFNGKGGVENAADARSYKTVANTLEEILINDLNTRAAANPYGQYAELARAYPEARKQMAQAYFLDEVTDYNTNKVDPKKFADATAGDSALSGKFAEIGKAVGNFPESVKMGEPTGSALKARLYRSTPSGVLGSIIGGSMAGPAGVAIGGVAGAGAGLYAGNRLAKNLASRKVQSGGVNPVPRSLWDLSDQDPLIKRWEFPEQEVFRESGGTPEGVSPALPPPTGPRGPVEGAPAPYRHPNFQFGENNPPQPAPPGTAMTRGEPLTPEQQWAQDKANFAAQDRTQYGRESAMDDLARQKAEAEAAALRQPASRERVLDLNPMTGRLEPTSRGLPGATPDVVKSTGGPLESAAKKLVEGRAFDMTLEEKAAWKYTRVEMAQSIPELKGMSERQIFDRVQDRQWVADTIKKLREKDIAFEGIRRTAEENAARLEAAKQRELLADKLEVMQAQFDAEPLRQEPKTQGPKTRAEKRKLSGKDATIVVNELRRR